MPRNSATLLAILVTASATIGCATRSPIETERAQAEARATESQAVPTASPAASAAATREATPSVKTKQSASTAAAEQELATLRVEAGALVTQVNGNRQLACTTPDCNLSLPAGTHRFTVGYKDTETRAGSRVTFASMHSRIIEVTLEPGHSYSLSASGRYTPKWWIAVEDRTANKTVYNDRERSD